MLLIDDFPQYCKMESIKLQTPVCSSVTAESNSNSAAGILNEQSILLARWCLNSLVILAGFMVGLLWNLSQKICFKVDFVCFMYVSCCIDINFHVHALHHTPNITVHWYNDELIHPHLILQSKEGLEYHPYMSCFPRTFHHIWYLSAGGWIAWHSLFCWSHSPHYGSGHCGNRVGSKTCSTISKPAL